MHTTAVHIHTMGVSKQQLLNNGNSGKIHNNNYYNIVNNNLVSTTTATATTTSTPTSTTRKYSIVSSSGSSSGGSDRGSPPHKLPNAVGLQNNQIVTHYVKLLWCLLKRRHVVLFCAVVLLLLTYTNSVLFHEDDTQRPVHVQHHSHVPGMKTNSTNDTTIEANADVVVDSSHVYSQNSTTPPPPPTQQHSVAILSDVVAAAAAAADANAAAAAAANDNNHNNNNFITSINSTFLPRLLPPTSLPGDNDNNAHYKGYLVWSDQCKMPSIDPYDPEMMKYFKRNKFKPCSTIAPMTSVQFNATSRRYVLQLHEDRLSAYGVALAGKGAIAVDCCYESVRRTSNSTSNSDVHITYDACVHFYGSTQLPPTVDNVLVTCYAPGDATTSTAKPKVIYMNGHATMPEREEIRERIQKWRKVDAVNGKRPPNVLMIGIDSISRIHLIRAMPKTAQYLYDNEWFEMSGYNKIDDNTFPNLMAVLTGYNRTSIYDICPPSVRGGLVNCTFVWQLFREHGYLTAYGEDATEINTFNYLKEGFVEPPVDYYLRPFLIAAEHRLADKSRPDCMGPLHNIEVVYEYAMELAQRFPANPYFGLFWTNSLSHDYFSACTALDEKMIVYLQRLSKLGALNNTVVVFFSDHGMRFGPVRRIYSSHFEERLPFMFLWLPPYLKNAHPEFVNALSVNKNRLTNPYDVHMTLKHVLALSGRVSPQRQPPLMQPLSDCPRCHSLFEPAAHNRSCNDVAIEDHWCTCIPFQNIYKNSKLVHHITELTIQYLNEFVRTFNNGSIAKLCVPLRMGKIDSVYRALQSNSTEDKQSTIYRINFYTKPNQALFEATVRYNAHTDSVYVTGEVSRLNSYSMDSACIGDGAAKKYCSCHKHLK